MINSSNSSKRVETGYINPTTTCEYKTSIDSTYVAINVSDTTSNLTEDFNLRISFDYIYRSQISLYTYNLSTKEFTLINQTTGSGSDDFNVVFNRNTAVYVNFYSYSRVGCAGFDVYVTQSGFVPENQTFPVVDPIIDPYTYSSQSTGDSKTLSAGAIVGIVLGAVLLISFIICLVCLRKRITSMFSKFTKKSTNKKVTVESEHVVTKGAIIVDQNNIYSKSGESRNKDDQTTNQAESRDDQEAPAIGQAIQIAPQANQG